MKPPETMSLNLETEKMKFGLLMAADIVAGKVVDLDLFILAKVKGSMRVPVSETKVTFLDGRVDIEEIMARRSPPPAHAKVPDDIDEKFKEYSILYPSDGSIGEGPARNELFK